MNHNGMTASKVNRAFHAYKPSRGVDIRHADRGCFGGI